MDRAALPNLAVLDQGGGSAARRRALRQRRRSALGGPRGARRATLRNSPDQRSSFVIHAVLCSKALQVLGRSCRVQASPHCGQVMHDGWDQAETQTVSVP